MDFIFLFGSLFPHDRYECSSDLLSSIFRCVFRTFCTHTFCRYALSLPLYLWCILTISSHLISVLPFWLLWVFFYYYLTSRRRKEANTNLTFNAKEKKPTNIIKWYKTKQSNAKQKPFTRSIKSCVCIGFHSHTIASSIYSNTNAKRSSKNSSHGMCKFLDGHK